MITKKKIINILESSLLPLMAAVYPSILHYANNVSILVISSFFRIALFNLVIAIAVYIVVLALCKYKNREAALATFIFLVFFNTYGIVYNYLIEIDIFRVEHYTLLPLYLLASIYAGWLITKISERFTNNFLKNAVLILSALIVFNLVKIVPSEIVKIGKLGENSSESVAVANDTDLITQSYRPDIYYILFDEFSGFDAMRNYWHYNEVDDFVLFLKQKGFFVAEKSHSLTIDTLQIMSSRLNYTEYPLGGKYRNLYYHDIANNKVMGYLETLGYTTIVFDESRTSIGYPAKTQISADYNLGYKSGETGSLGVLFDDYGVLVSNNTMLLAFSKYYQASNPIYQQHRGMILYTVENITTPEIESPKFVYVHLMLPHMPFMFDESGNITDLKNYTNWNSYLGNYKYAIRVAEKMVTNILSGSDPKNPPVIILQSDHGARNKLGNSTSLQDFPEEFKTNIMFTLYLPGYDTSKIPQDVDPVNTFPIVFNYLFDANIPLK